MPLSVELLVFSGNQDPKFTLDDAETAQIAASVAQCLSASGSRVEQAEPSILGYRGLRVVANLPTFAGSEVVTIRNGLIIVPSPEGLLSFADSARCETQLLAIARRRGFSDLLAKFGAPKGNA